MQEQPYLIDCGEGTQLRMREMGLSILKIDHIFITHLHGDHYFGLVGLISTMHLLGRVKPLHIYGPPQLSHVIQNQLMLSDARLRFGFDFHPLVLETPQVIFENKVLEVIGLPLNHSAPTTGFLFREKKKERNILPEMIEKYDIPIRNIKQIKKGADLELDDGRVIPNEELTKPPPSPRSYAYCTDTAYMPELSDWIKGVDLLYHDATFPEERKERAEQTMHSTAAQAATVARDAGAKKLLLGHFSARYKDMSIFEGEAREIFPCSEIANDGDTISIPIDR